MKQRRSGARLWLLAFIGFWLLNAAWAFAAPYDGPPDEQQHALRAAAVADGQLVAGENRGQDIPLSLFRYPFCFPMNITVSADCAVPPGGDETVGFRYVSEARFNPVYYAVIGWPLGIWPNWSGIMLSRLLNGAAMAALLACALVGASRWTRHRAVVTGMVVAITPMIAHLGGAINPNGVEIAAGVALFAALIAVLHEQRQGINKAAVALAGVSASVLVTPRFSGVMWLGVILTVMLLPSSWTRIKELARSRTVQIWSGVVVLATIASAAWTMLVGTAEITGTNKGLSALRIIRVEVLDMLPNSVMQMIGVMGWAETPIPRIVYPIWYMTFGLLLLGALVLGSRVDRWRLLLLLVGVFGPLCGMEMLLANTTGFWNQGRYFLPGAVGLPMLAAYIMARRGLTAEHMRTMTRLLAVILLPIHLISLPFVMPRWQSGYRTLNPFRGDWLPHYGTVLPLVTITVAVAVLFVMYWQASRIPVEPPPAQPDQAIDDEVPAEPTSKAQTVSV